MIDALLQRAQQLIASNRYPEAEKELRNILAQAPDRVDAKALFAICLAQQNKVTEGLDVLGSAMSQQPDNDYLLYLHALLLLKAQKPAEARKSIENAITFNPRNAEYFGVRGSIDLQQKNWKEALDSANAGLQINPENLQCLNVRSTALFKLDSKEEAYETIREALQNDPENLVTHANIGWGLLEQGDHREALEHFREALRIDPTYAYAKAGMVEALKARYWFYRIFLKYAFWVNNMKAKGQWILIIGLYIGIRILNGIAETDASLAVFIKPVIYLYMAFAISTWLIEPLSNLFLRLNVYGRYALTKDEVMSSNFVGASLLIAIGGTLFYLFKDDPLYVLVIIFGIAMMIPLASMFNASRTKHRKILVGYTVGLAAIGILGMVSHITTGDAGVLQTLFLIGVIAYQWVANAFMIR